MRGTIAILAATAVAALGLSRQVQANIVGDTTITSTSNWAGTPVSETGAQPTTGSGGTSQDNDSWGGNANGLNGFGALAQAFEVTTSGTLATAQLVMAGSPQTFNVELYNFGPAPAGYQAAPNSAPFITQINGVGNATSQINSQAFAAAPNLLQTGDTTAYGGAASGAQNVDVLTFEGADASVPLVAGNLYVLSLDPTTNADGTWWVRGGVPIAAFNTGEGLNADGSGGLQAFEGKSSVRDFDLGVTESVPEPATLGLIGVASLSLLARRRRA
jgi:PEP-CTERM motif